MKIPFRSLYLKIFIWFWLAMIIINVAFFAAHDYRYERIVGDRVLPSGQSPEADLREGTNFLFSPR